MGKPNLKCCWDWAEGPQWWFGPPNPLGGAVMKGAYCPDILVLENFSWEYTYVDSHMLYKESLSLG